MLAPLTDINGRPLVGGAITAVEKALLPFGAFSDMKNLRNEHPSLIKRPGCRALHTSADSTNQVYSLYLFSKSRVTDMHFFAQMSDGDILEATALPPTVTTGAFGSEVFSGTTGQIRASWAVLDDLLLMSEGADQHKLYAGQYAVIKGFHVVKMAAAHPFIPLVGEDYTTQVTDPDSTTVAILDSLADYSSGYDAFYICSETPINVFNFTIAAANANSAELAVDYWNGAWTNDTITDNTSSGGATLAQSGTVVMATTAANRTDEIPRYMFGKSGFWYKFYLTGTSATQEDLTGYTEVDSASDITITAAKAAFDTMQSVANSYVYYDFGVGYFHDFSIQFEAEVTAATTGSGNGQAMLAGLGNIAGTWGDLQTAGHGIMVDAYYNGSMIIRLYDASITNSDTTDLGAVTAFGPYYFTFERSTTTATLYIYDDAARTSLVDTLTITCEGTTMRYLHVLGSRDAAGTSYITGYTQNFLISPTQENDNNQDLTGYTEVDSASDITVTAAKADVDSMTQVAVSWVVGDLGAGYFGDFKINFEAEVTASDSNGEMLIISVSNTAGSDQDQTTANDGMIVKALNNGGSFELRLICRNTDNSDIYVEGGSTLPHYYFSMIRSGTTLVLQIYSDASRETLVDTLSIVSESGTKRYLHAVASRDSAGANTITGYTQNFSIITVGAAAASLDSETEVSQVTYDCEEFIDIVNVWNAAAQYGVEIQVEGADGWEVYGAGAVNLDTLAAASKIMIASADPIVGIYIDPGAVPNASGTALTSLKYWDGSAFQTVGTVEDGTNGMQNAGWLTFPRQSDVHPLQWKTTQYYAYWYELIWDSELAADMLVTILTMPYFDITDFGSIGKVNCVWKDRAIYTFNKYPQYLYVSSQHSPFIMNGDDFGILKAGDGRANAVVCAKTFHNELLVAQEEKGVNGGCLTLFEGYSPATFGKLVLSTEIGSMNANSMVTVDGVLTATKTEEVIKTIVYGLSRYGVWATDGNTVSIISDDIENYFDPTQSECIRYGYEEEMWIKHDQAYNVLRIGLVSGSSATKCNVFPVYDILTRTWSFDTPSQELSTMENVEAGSGNIPVLQVGGGIDDGLIYQLNYGTNDVSAAINASVTIELGLNGEVISFDEFLMRVKAQAAGDITMEIYENDILQATTTLSMLVEITNQTYRRHRFNVNIQGQQISVKLYNNTASQSLELLQAGFKCSRWINR